MHGPNMKTLFLVRHAKSSWKDNAQSDRDRPLKARGERDVLDMGKRLSRRNIVLDLIKSSPAVRALATAKVIAKALDYKRKKIVVDGRLYGGTANELIEIISELDDSLDRVMLFGHNPELTDLAHRFSADITHMPTCAIAAFTFDCKTWADTRGVTPVDVDIDLPKQASRFRIPIESAT